MAHNLKELHPGKWSVSYLDDEEPIRIDCNSMTEAFRCASKLEAFSDCSYVHTIRVHHAGRTYRYIGWQPGMKYEYVNQTGVTVWRGWFPEWDH